MLLAQSSPIVHQPTVFHLGPLELTGFGVALLLAFLVALIIARSELSRRGWDPEEADYALTVIVIGFIVGAKLYYVAVTGDTGGLFSRSGLVFWGGFIGATLAVAISARMSRLNFFRIADVGAPGIAAGYAVGRTGCWAVGDDYGRPWDGFLATAFPQGLPPSTAEVMSREYGVVLPPGTPPDAVLSVHPTQLYETVLGFAMFMIIWRYRDHRHAAGWLFGVYMLLAGVERFLIEFVRAKGDRFLAGLSTAQYTAIGVTLVGIAFMYWLREPTAERPGIMKGSRK